MRLAISNIAWDVAEDEAVATLLESRGVDAVDLAPTKYFPRAADATDADIERVRTWWAGRGFEITGMQALLFGTTGLNVFGDEAVRQATLRHLDAVCRIGGGLGATRLVFGSPKNRDRAALDDDATRAASTAFFRRLGDRAETHGVVVCLEPNPPCYGANFMIDSEETARVVREVDHPAIRMQLDIGALTINAEDAVTTLSRCRDLVAHIHASEPDLVPLGDAGTDHRPIAAAIEAALPGTVVCIEMAATRAEPHLDAIARALDVAVLHYRRGGDDAVR